MKLARYSFLLLILCCTLWCCSNRKGPAKILVFSKTSGFVHSSIPNGIDAIQKLAAENGMIADTTSNANYFTQDSLDRYAAVVFLNTTGDVLDFYQEVSFERYIQAGGSFVGVHAATDTEYAWSWYGDLVGAYFKSHPQIQEAKFNVSDHSCEACAAALDAEWIRTDELYNFKDINSDINVIMTVDENTYDGGENGASHPMAWYHEFDGGRSFYTALGHTEESYEEEKFLAHLLAGIQYAVGENQKLNYSMATTPIPPDPARFTKENLVGGVFFEPTEMAILPNKDVLIAERRGELYLYKASTKKKSLVGKLDVYYKTNVPNVNAEEGFMGLQKDPNFAENNWIYTFYSPTGDEWVNRLSRFKFENDTLNLDTEEVILDVYSQREICCHTGGSITFGPEGLLYLSTGDNSTPFNEPDAKFVNNGFAPLNDLPGKTQYDARRSSGNTNDLRGKILRIKVNDDGSYDIPEGNLFPPGTPKTRPEIYTMGHRNPYRISVDPKHGWVYWGDVGPDARDDDFEARGPRGYDEHNVAREAGNYGWPLFIGNNEAYFDYDYSNGKTGDRFDSKKPINDSKNNTGLTELPPANAPYLYYDYGESSIFDGTESGGRNAMAGPTYYKDIYQGRSNIPDYYDGKIFIYDWMRNWMKAVTFGDNGDVKRIEPFAPEVDLANLIDMELGPDGNIYLLEYGSGWFTANDDSGMSVLKYHKDNLPPTLNEFKADQTAGVEPLTVVFSAKALDKDKDDISYIWDLGDGNIKETTEPTLTYTYEETGSFDASLEIRDTKNMKANSQTIPIISGNTRPELSLELKGGNSSFFIPGVPIDYEVSVSDFEDDEEGIDESKIYVTVDYLEGFDEASLSMGHQEVSPAAMGEALTSSLICKTCHNEKEKSIGPTYLEVAEKYANVSDAASYLREKIVEGGTGVWGEVVMPANPTLKSSEADQIVKYILSLAGERMASLPPSGSIIPEQNDDSRTMVVTASYIDRGALGTVPLTGSKRIALNSNVISMESAVDVEAFNPVAWGDMNLLILDRDGGHFAMDDLDLTGVGNITIGVGWQSPPKKGIEMEIRLGSPDGEVLGKNRIPPPAKDSQFGAIPIKLNKKINSKKNKLFFVYNPSEEDRFGMLTFVAVANLTFGGD